MTDRPGDPADKATDATADGAFGANIPRKRVSYEWPRQALGSAFGLTVGASVYTVIAGKVTPILGASCLLLVAACVWSLCCIAWNAWLAVREEVGRE